MSTVSEIQEAIQRLEPLEYREFLAWFEEHQAMMHASEALFALYDKEESDAPGSSR